MNDFWRGVIQIVALAVLMLIWFAALGVFRDKGAPITLSSNEWTCMEHVPVTSHAPVLVNNIIVPINTTTYACVSYLRNDHLP